MWRTIAILVLFTLMAACAAPAQPTPVAKSVPTLAPAASSLKPEPAAPTVAPTAAQAQPSPVAATPAPAVGDLDQLIAKAKQEGQVMVYGSAGQASMDRLVKGFEAKYGIKAEANVIPASGLIQRFESDLKAGNLQNDVLQHSDELHAQDVVQRGELMALTPQDVPSLAQWPKAFWNGYYAKFSIITNVFIYNTNLVTAADVPKDWPDLLDAKWKGKFAIFDPRAALAISAQYGILMDDYGEDFLRKLAAQQPRVINNPTAGGQTIAAGDVPLFVWGYPYITVGLKGKGAPVADVTPPKETGAERLIMIPAKAKRPNAAKLFLNWALSPEGQQAFNGDFQATSPLPNIPTTMQLPAGYVSPDLAKAKQRDAKIKELLGLP